MINTDRNYRGFKRGFMKGLLGYEINEIPPSEIPSPFAGGVTAGVGCREIAFYTAYMVGPLLLFYLSTIPR
jgi:hypothetical protein